MASGSDTPDPNKPKAALAKALKKTAGTKPPKLAPAKKPAKKV